MIELIMKIYNAPLILKRAIKKMIFDMNSSYGVDLVVSAFANCKSENKENLIIGDYCEICGTLISMHKGKIQIGNYTTIRGESVIGSINSITIGDFVIISNNVHIYDNNNHPTDPKLRIEMCKSGFYGDKWDWKYAESKPIVIENNVWIGERSAILKGVTIGEGAIIASNSVVTKNVMPYTIVAGNPAIFVKKIGEK